MALSVGFTSFVFSTDATQAKGLLAFTPVGLPPTEHVCFFLDTLVRKNSAQRFSTLNRPSLTTPAVSRVFLSFFLFLITELAHTSPLTHEACPFRSSLLTCGTLTCSARPVSVHQFSVAHQTSLRSRFNHDELFELPLLQGRRVA